MREVALAVAAVAGCGAPPADVPTAAPVASLDATPASRADVVVATVDGHPVYASCVAAQAAHDHVDARAALRECIDFELLARAAAARGLAADADVRDAQRDAMVNRVVEREFEDRVMTPADFGPLWQKIVARYAPRVDHDEFRGSTYARVPVARGASAEVDEAAHAVIAQVAALVAGRTGLMSADLVDAAAQIEAATHASFMHADVPPYTRDGLDTAYSAALFALPAVGMASPPVRTALGWDVVLYTVDVPEHHVVGDELVAGLMPDARKVYFQQAWIDELTRSMHLTVSVDKDAVARLEDAP